MNRSNSLHDEYQRLMPTLVRVRKAVLEQISSLVDSTDVTLGVPIESRIKTWTSIEEKLERKHLQPTMLSDLTDLIGVRVILLFQRDIDLLESEIQSNFKIHSLEDAAERLHEGQFGYQSRHYSVSVPDSWEQVPSFKGLSHQKVELQVRTLTQHIWAVASHKLQYKREKNVPPPLRRSIYRASALLEMVDLEFGRLLEEREQYAKVQTKNENEGDELNTTVIEVICDKILPAPNKDAEGESYSEIIDDLDHFDIRKQGDLTNLLLKHKDAIINADKQEVSNRYGSEDDDPDEIGEHLSHRFARGVFFTHVGLIRQALSEEFGRDAVERLLLSRPPNQ